MRVQWLYILTLWLMIGLCMLLMYDEWRNRGEIELLHARLDGFADAFAPSPVAETLGASNDDELETIAREQL